MIPSQIYQDFWELLQNPKTPKIVLDFSNHAQRFNPPYYVDVEKTLSIKVDKGKGGGLGKVNKNPLLD